VDKEKEIASHASEILGEDITPEDIKDQWVNVEVALQNIEYRLEMIEDVLGIEEGYTLPCEDITPEILVKQAKELIAKKRRKFNEG